MNEEMEQEEQLPEEVAVTQEAQVQEETVHSERNLREDERDRLLRDHIELLKAQQAPKPRQKEPEVNFESDDDIFTVGQAKKAFKELQRANEELRVAAKHKDYEEVITKYLPEAIKENPAIRSWLERDDAPYEKAYFLAKKSDAYLRDRVAKTRSDDAKKLAKNTSSTGSLSSVGSNSSARGTVDYKNMSDDDFDQLVAKNLWG